MKRTLHYLILAAVLLGVPLACCMLGGYDGVLETAKQFPPRTEDWGFHPEKLWNVRRPFNWWWFLGMATFTAACLFPFLRRGFRTLNSQLSTLNPRPRFPRWGYLGLVLLVASWTIAWSRFPCFSPYAQALLSYFPVWMGYIVTMNAVVKWRSGTCPMTERPWLYAASFPASALFWWFFEYLNRFVWNWYYLGIAGFGAVEYTVYATLCFASVLPAVYVTAEFLGTFRFFDDRNYEGMPWKPDVRSPVSCCVLAVLSAVGLCGIVFVPEYVYLFLWISPLMVFVLVQVLLREPCILDRLRTGSWGFVFRFEIAALCCGLCWETWNYYAYAKWVYAVPWVHGFQVWEMPLIGFAGYLPFGVECAAVTAWLGLPVSREGSATACHSNSGDVFDIMNGNCKRR